jgi:hypothetical protein
MRSESRLWAVAEYRTNKAGQVLFEGLILDSLCNLTQPPTNVNQTEPFACNT